jgi:predicted nucleic acid-binding protein
VSEFLESLSGNVLPIAREFGLSAYGGAYLELTVRHGAALATLDAKLAQAQGWNLVPGYCMARY